MSNNSTCTTYIQSNNFDYVCVDKVSFVMLIAALAFIVIIVFTIVGNTLVILVILKDKKHQTPSNYLIMSLAVTDLIVGLITVPIRAVNELKDYGTWPYGAFWCDFRVVIDRLCVDASIFHLLAIAVDRYLSVTSVQYSITRNNRRILIMIGISWFLAFWLAMAAALGWRDSKYQQRIQKHICIVSTDFSLNLTVWLVVFMIPVTLMVILYARVYQIAKSTLRCKPGRVKDMSSLNYKSNSRSKSTLTIGDSSASEKQSRSGSSVTIVGSNLEEVENQSSEEKRERKIAKTLIIITGCVIVCWLPWFTYYTLADIFGVKFATNSNLPFKITIWMGYLNSMLNPFIYAVTNPYYRRGFKKVLGIR